MVGTALSAGVGQWGPSGSVASFMEALRSSNFPETKETSYPFHVNN